MGIAYKLSFFSLAAVVTLILHVQFRAEFVIGLCLLLLAYLAAMSQTPSALREIWRVMNDN